MTLDQKKKEKKTMILDKKKKTSSHVQNACDKASTIYKRIFMWFRNTLKS